MAFPGTKAVQVTEHQKMGPEDLMNYPPPAHLKVPGQEFCLYVQLTTKDEKYPTAQTCVRPIWMPLCMLPTERDCELIAKRLHASGWNAFSTYVTPAFQWQLFSGADHLKPEQRRWVQDEMKGIFGQFTKELREQIEDLEARTEGMKAPVQSKTREEIEAEVRAQVEAQIRDEIESRLKRQEEPVETKEEPKRKKRSAVPEKAQVIKPIGVKTQTPMAFSIGKAQTELPAGATVISMSD